jgi:hypothetical protein
MFFQFHRTLVEEINYMLEEFTDPKKVQKRMKDLEEESQHPTPSFSTESFVDIDAKEPKPIKPVPNYFPHSFHVSNSLDEGC